MHSTIESCDWFGEYNVINRESRAKREQKREKNFLCNFYKIKEKYIKKMNIRRRKKKHKSKYTLCHKINIYYLCDFSAYSNL